jgi:uncharacterized membrane protein
VVDTESTAQPVVPALHALGRRVAVGSGALVALVSLLVRTPVWVASVRGAGTTLAVLLVLRLAAASLGRDLAGARGDSDA